MQITLTFIPICRENGKRVRRAFTLARLTLLSKMMPNAHGDALNACLLLTVTRIRTLHGNQL
jgi:hypothetical protein